MNDQPTKPSNERPTDRRTDPPRGRTPADGSISLIPPIPPCAEWTTCQSESKTK
jgi:hypothetical protein